MRGAFAQELHRACAQRGKLDCVYQELSDDWTVILQRLFPVWALIGPGLAEPGHIRLRTRTVFLDSEELLGTREQILTGRLEQRAILRTFGVAIHEVLHAKHTKVWISEHDRELSESEDADDRQRAVDRSLLEEPRMEATGCREYPETTARGRFVRRALGVAVADCIIPRFLDQYAQAQVAGRPVTRDMAGRVMTYVHARTHYGVVDPAALTTLHRIWRMVLGDADYRRLDDLYARLIWVPDGDNHALSVFADEYRQIIGPPDPSDGGGAAGESGEGDGSGQGAGDGSGSGSGSGQAGGQGGPDIGSLQEALEHALEQSASSQVEQLNEDVSLKDTLEQAARTGEKAPDGENGGGTGAATGRMPDRGVNRPPYPDEVLAARRLAQRLQQAIVRGTKRIDKRMPGGRFDGRAYARGRFERATGRPVTSHPWQITRTVRAPIEEPHIGVIIDTSGSMGDYEYALGPIAWILSEAFRTIGGRVAQALFGNGAELLTDGTQPMALVPAIKTGGGTAFGGDAIEMVCEHLEMENPRRPRALYILSDGGWFDSEAGVNKVRWLKERGVPTIHLSIRVPPLSVEADRVVVIEVAADAFDVIANDTVAALEAASRPRPVERI